MRLERLSNNKIKVFVSEDDLFERGLSLENVSHDSLKWQQLFHDMLEEANDEFGISSAHSVTIEIFSLQNQGIVLIATLDNTCNYIDNQYEGDITDIRVVYDNNKYLLFKFDCFEHVVQLAQRLSHLDISGGSLYKKGQFFYLYFNAINYKQENDFEAILAEYGDRTYKSIHFIKEYSSEIIKKDVIKTIVHYFN